MFTWRRFFDWFGRIPAGISLWHESISWMQLRSVRARREDRGPESSIQQLPFPIFPSSENPAIFVCDLKIKTKGKYVDVHSWARPLYFPQALA